MIIQLYNLVRPQYTIHQKVRDESEQNNSYVVAFALLALMMLSLPLSVRAEGEKHGAVDVVGSPEHMLNSLKGVLAGQRAELADLKASLQQLETRQAAVQTEINVYDSQDTSHAQLLLASQPRIDELENALKNNRLASKRMAELVEMFQERYDATTILIQKTAERMELAIEIGFPQRDLHIRTIPREITPAASTGEAEPGR